ncbi:MAG: hypothetical protein JW715_00480 [Sedimentisphaerales bacterium]|nr:hypothetical protein [Sedimentisphaerales bacterium]
MLRNITKTITMITQFFFAVIILCNTGCRQQSQPPVISDRPDNESEKYSVFAEYSPKEVDIIPLTGFVNSGDVQQSQINLFVSLLDSFGSEIKSPCVFRFELYEKVQRSAEPKGRRINIWPDIDLTESNINNKYWRNYLRAYEFNLPFAPAGSQTYILEVTVLCPTGKRLTSDFTLNPSDDSSR